MKVYLATVYLLDNVDSSDCEEDVGVFDSREKAVEAARKAVAEANSIRHAYDYWIRSFEVQ